MARSRYNRSNVIDKREYATFTLEQSNSIKEPDTFNGIQVVSYTVKAGDRLDHLAATFLNDDKYYWAIALVNNLVSPFITPGQKLSIPIDIVQVLDRI